MRQPSSPHQAIENEFGCYYLGDELPPLQSDAFRASLPQRTWTSAIRLREAVGEDRVGDLIRALESLKTTPDGILMGEIESATLIGWTDDPQDWAVFQGLVDQIIDFLRKAPGPRPT
jgi:hypothetical protein